MTIPEFVTVLCTCWWTAEFIRSRFKTAAVGQDQDRSSSKLFDVAHFFGIIGVVVGFTGRGHIRSCEGFISLSGAALMVVGLVIRWKAIVTLGEQFTGKVKIFSTQRLIQNGPYKHVRHPGYTGGLLAHLGMAIAFSNWISILLIFFPVVVAAIYRMHVEEEALLRAFGNEYAEYSSRTKRLVPMIY